MTQPKRWKPVLALVIVLALVAAACSPADEEAVSTTEGVTETTAGAPDATEPAPDATTTTGEEPMEPLVFGMILVGPENDHGWSQAHHEAGLYIEEKLGAEMITLDKVNTSDRPDTRVEQVVDDMIAQGAQLVFMTSDDMRDGALAAAAAHPEVPMIWSSGDTAWADGEGYADLANLGNSMGRMYYAKMAAGCAAAMTTQTGSLSYLGPLINDETRRLVNSAFLGAKHCWTEILGNDAADLKFEVNWIGFWFNIPGFTLDPTEVTNAFFDGGTDVVISGIDTTEALVVAGQRSNGGEAVWAVPYDFEGACEEAPEVCLGVPYFNWRPHYLEIATSVQNDTFTADWQWNGPDWDNPTSQDTSAIGWVPGDALSGEAGAALDGLFVGLASGSTNLFTGPLNYQDGSEYLADGAEATDHDLWYTTQLLEGVEGPSS